MRTSKGWQSGWGKAAAALLLAVITFLGLAPGGWAGSTYSASASGNTTYALNNSNSGPTYPFSTGRQWTLTLNKSIAMAAVAAPCPPPPGGGWSWDDSAKRFYRPIGTQGGTMTEYYYTKTVGGATTYDPSKHYRLFVKQGTTTNLWFWYNQNFITYELLPTIPTAWDKTNPTVWNRSAQRFEVVTKDAAGKKVTDIYFLSQDLKSFDAYREFHWYNQGEVPDGKLLNNWYWYDKDGGEPDKWLLKDLPPAAAPTAWNGLKSGSWNFWSKRFEMKIDEKPTGGAWSTYIDVYYKSPKVDSYDTQQHWHWYQAAQGVKLKNQWDWYNGTAWEAGKTQQLNIKNTRVTALLVNISFGGGVFEHKWTDFDWSTLGLNIKYVAYGTDPTALTLLNPNGFWTLYTQQSCMVGEVAAGKTTTVTYRFNHPTDGGDAMLFMSKETDSSKPLYDGYDKYDANNPLSIWGAANTQLDCMHTRFEWNLYRWLPDSKKYGDGAFNLSMVNGYNGGLAVGALDYKGVSKTLFNAQNMFQNWSNVTDRTYGLGSDWAPWPWKPPYEYIFTNPTNPKYCDKTGKPFEFRVADPYAYPNAKGNIGVKWDATANHWTGLDAPGVEQYSDTSMRLLAIQIGNKSLISGYTQRDGMPPIVKLAGGWLMEARALSLGGGYDVPPGNPVGWLDPSLGDPTKPATYRDFSKPYDPIANRYVPDSNKDGHLFWTPSQLGLLALLPKY